MEKPKARQDSIERTFTWEDILEVQTAKGSTYRYLPDGTTQRYKAVEGKEYEPQSALVYVPDYAWVIDHAPRDILARLGENELVYTEILLEYVQNPRNEPKKVYIIDSKGNKLDTNQEIKDHTDQLYLAFINDGVVDFSIPVFSKPKVGFMTFDTRVYRDEKTGERMREKHLGNKVVKITLKE